VRTDVRIIAATHQDLEELVRRGRLPRGPVPSPQRDPHSSAALRERREDIPRLMEHFFQQAAEELGGEPKMLLPETERSSCPWTGPATCASWKTPAAG
jgi:two-component system nitrogen regulation response regulator GlnG